jgi:ABC-type sugar transport system substrate-binding protein
MINWFRIIRARPNAVEMPPGLRLPIKCFAITAWFVLLASPPCHAEPTANAHTTTQQATRQDRVKVKFINPSAPDNIFWNKMTQFMQAAANSLDMDLSVSHGNENRFHTTREVQNAMSKAAADYYIYIYQVGEGLNLLNHAESLKAKSIIINTNVPPEDQVKAGTPRKIFSQWQAHFIPDDVAAGALLAQYLSSKSRRINPDRPPEIIALNGSLDSTAAIDRKTGLENFLRAHADVKLNQLTWARWDAQLAEFQTERLLVRYPGTCIIWSASDGMIIGAIRALSRQANRSCRPVIGGVDWSDWGIDAVKNGELDATVGGHFMEGAWALVLIHDLSRGIQMTETDYTLRTPMALLTQENISLLQIALAQESWQRIDFKKFTRAHSGASSYDFSVSAVLKQLQPPD